MYRDDDAARAERAQALIQEIAHLERKKVAQAAADQRLAAARDELPALQPPAAAPPERPPGLAPHLLEFGATAAATFLGYTLLF